MGNFDGLYKQLKSHFGVEFPYLEFPKKAILMDYVSMSKTMKISFLWGSKIAFLGNY
jgi:hypothetical protein